jgi:hypothetical protein
MVGGIWTLEQLIEAVIAPHGPGRWVLPEKQVREAFEADFEGASVETVAGGPDGQERIAQWARRKRTEREFWARPAPD